MHPGNAQALHGPEAFTGMHRLPQVTHSFGSEACSFPLPRALPLSDLHTVAACCRRVITPGRSAQGAL